MTTILADAKEGVMVCDSKMTLGSEWVPVTKVVRVGDELIGFSGVATEAERWISWYSTGQNGPKPKVDNSNALILGPKGLRVLDSSGGFINVERGFMGTGSGGMAATAAFMAGADAETAVHIACQIDANSGGDVIVHRLKA
jgi:ATP-dependent protease HslVU (ClpYQ) peptidase subunit